jgi:aspartate/methionine/tyrosine aminotransferase
MVDAGPLGWKDDWALVDFLARKVGVLAVPGSSFYTRTRGTGGGKTKARVNFAKKEETLREAVCRLDAADLAAGQAARRAKARSAR